MCLGTQTVQMVKDWIFQDNRLAFPAVQTIMLLLEMIDASNVLFPELMDIMALKMPLAVQVCRSILINTAVKNYILMESFWNHTILD